MTFYKVNAKQVLTLKRKKFKFARYFMKIRNEVMKEVLLSCSIMLVRIVGCGRV